MKNGQKRIKHFSWLEYAILFVGSMFFAALPGILSGADISLLWSVYTIWYVIYWAVIAGALCAVIGYLEYRKFDRPLHRLSEAASRVANGDFSVYVEPEHTLDKLDYIDDFNKMVAELGSIETLNSDFVSNVSHEIKTPLSVIKNYTMVLKNKELPPEMREEYMDTVIDATNKLASLITNILKLNKLDNQEIAPAPEPYDLCRQLCDCALQFETLWEQKNITFEADIEDRAVITADKSLLELVWNNLLANALKFTEPGGKVTLQQTSDENEIVVTVADTGCGISHKTMKHIFDKFYQGETSQAKEGNGLGLALANRAIQRAGGTLAVDSELGKGSIFTVRLAVRT